MAHPLLNSLSRGAARFLPAAPRNFLMHAAALLAVCVPAPALAQSAPAAEQTRDPYPLEIFQSREDRLFQIGYRLATANAPFCERTVPTLGLLIHDARSYGNASIVRQLFGLAGDIGVQSAALGSPAYAAGLRQNATLVRVDGEDIETRWLPGKEGFERPTAIRNWMDDALTRGPVTLGWTDRDGTVSSATVAGVPACQSRFELIDSSIGASADGSRVSVGENFPAFAYTDDEFAAAIAHEMAHNLLGHLDLFEETGRKRQLVRLSERDADRLMPWLLHNAGYDPEAAVRFMRQWGPRYGGWIFRKRTHDGWDERVELIEAELPRVAAAATANGKADWKTGFVRLLQPE